MCEGKRAKTIGFKSNYHTMVVVFRLNVKDLVV